MADIRAPIAAAARFVHGRLLWLLIASYALAALWPGPGLAARGVSFGTASLAGESVRLSMPAALLAVLLFNAGLGVRLDRAKDVLRRPALLAAGLAANLAVPLAVVAAAAGGLAWWHDTEEHRDLLVGRGVVGALPIDGASAGWAPHT